MKDKITIISTAANGGIKSVVDSYLTSSLAQRYSFHTIYSHTGKNKFLDIIFFLKAFVILIFSFANNSKIYHIHMSMRGSFVRKYILTILLKLYRKKVIIHLHGSEFKVFYNQSSKFTKKLIKDLFEKVDTVIVLSDSWKKFITSISPNSSIIVVNNFVDPIRTLESKSPYFEKVILFMGKVGQRKGAFDLIKAFSKIENINDYRLVMCGDGEINEAKKLVDSLNISHKVELIGWVNKEQKIHFYGISDVVILPSYNEGLPMTILEAMSCGKIVVTTPVGGIPEVINNNVNGFLVEPGNITSIANGLKTALTHENRDSIVKNAVSTYENKFSPEAILPKIEKIYRDLA